MKMLKEILFTIVTAIGGPGTLGFLTIVIIDKLFF